VGVCRSVVQLAEQHILLPSTQLLFGGGQQPLHTLSYEVVTRLHNPLLPDVTRWCLTKLIMCVDDDKREEYFQNICAVRGLVFLDKPRERTKFLLTSKLLVLVVTHNCKEALYLRLQPL
jgi:hypothetical protein